MAFGPARLYHRDNRAGKVFTDEVDYLEHLSNGWVDFPTKIKEPVAVVAAPEAAPVPLPDKPADIPMAKTKKPGRPAKKVKGGK